MTFELPTGVSAGPESLPRPRADGEQDGVSPPVDQHASKAGESRASCWKHRLLIGLCVFIVYAWFYQGAGDGQKAHYLTIRSIVEHRSFRIDFYPPQTGDIATFDGRVYSNKPPGFAVLASIVYWPIHAYETHQEIDIDANRVQRLNEYLIGLFLCVLPGVIVALVLRELLQGEGASPADATALAGAFAFGSLLFPYAGALTVHNFTAMGVLGSWALVSKRATTVRLLMAGALLGVTITMEYLAGPVAAILAVYVLVTTRRLSNAVLFCIGPAIGTLLLLWYSAAVFGSAFATSHTFQPAGLSDPDRVLEVFGWPDLRIFLWLTVHPFRGIFYYCPIMLIGVTGMGMAAAANWRRVLTPMLLAGVFIGFNVFFNGWTGGSFIGPRYLIPALPLLYLFTPHAFRRHRVLALVLIAISCCNMLAVTSERVVFPAPNSGPAPVLSDANSNPLADCYRRLTWNEVARHTESWNLGLKAGVTGLFSITPPVAVFLPLLVVAARANVRAKKASAKQ